MFYTKASAPAHCCFTLWFPHWDSCNSWLCFLVRPLKDWMAFVHNHPPEPSHTANSLQLFLSQKFSHIWAFNYADTIRVQIVQQEASSELKAAPDFMKDTLQTPGQLSTATALNTMAQMLTLRRHFQPICDSRTGHCPGRLLVL